jgi:hypothetical protein
LLYLAGRPRRNPGAAFSARFDAAMIAGIVIPMLALLDLGWRTEKLSFARVEPANASTLGRATAA